MQIHIALQAHVGEEVDLDAIVNHALLENLFKRSWDISQCTDAVKVSTISSTCKNCPAGKYQQYTGQTECKACACGKYSSSAATSCTSCKAGKYSSSGANSCSTCVAGKYSVHLEVVLVQSVLLVNMQDPEQHHVVRVVRVGINQMQDNRCSQCAVGKYSSAGADKCIVCPEGNYQSNTGASKCDVCLPGTYAAGNRNSVCSNCPSGSSNGDYGQGGCGSCEAGKYATSGSHTCT